ncbi:glycosyltransferase family 9 protein [uncultured Desulfobacter sp.]|uniref:glycosyltransferase family 9 protein n=1 Tax=uncultured Desulfobacter sp. TaxID=240139 RepID=UPI002AAC1CEF|nr:glycosyltransferase family 9 protein [uncultured Desulfobacter sp.]
MADSRKDLFDRVNRILIVKPSALGDIVHSMPFLYAVKQRFPWARIDWVVAHGLHTFLEGHTMINRLWVIKKDQWKKLNRLKLTLTEINDLRRGLAEQDYDVCIDLSGLFRSGLISGFSRAPVRLGFKESDEGSPFFYTHKIHGSMNIHAIDRYLKIAEFMGCPTDQIVYPFAPFNPVPAICKDLPEKYAVISPSAGKPANQWPARRYGELAARLDLPVVVIAAPAEADIAQKVVDASQGNAVSIAGRTGLKELCAVIQNAKFFICNDTGPMHMAAALNVPVFAIFGPANPVRTGPYGKIHTVIRKDYSCAPCYAWQPCRKWGFRCMQDLDVDEVFDVIREKLV